jgi:hypothetical protein
MTLERHDGWTSHSRLTWITLNVVVPAHDRFEHYVIPGGSKSLLSLGGALTAPSTAYMYDWPALPIGQQLWYKELMSYKDFHRFRLPRVSTAVARSRTKAGINSRAAPNVAPTHRFAGRSAEVHFMLFRRAIGTAGPRGGLTKCRRLPRGLVDVVGAVRWDRFVLFARCRSKSP